MSGQPVYIGERLTTEDHALMGVKGHVLIMMVREDRPTFDDIRKTLGIPSPKLIAALASMRREGMVTYHDPVNSSGITGLKLTEQGLARVEKAINTIQYEPVVEEVLASGPPHMQQTLSPIAPRPTIETSVVKVKTGRTRKHDQPSSIAEGGPVTITREGDTGEIRISGPITRPGPDTTPPVVEPTHTEVPVAPEDFPLLSALMQRENKRALAKTASETLEQAGLTDLAVEALSAIPDDSPLEQEMVKWIQRFSK